MGMIGSMAGSPLAQSQGSDVNKTQQDTADQTRQTQLNEKAEQAAGVGQTEEDTEATDRDADGRRLWEEPPMPPGDDGQDADPQGENAEAKSKDPTGQRGSRLDLSG
jgi:hypothetical protein